MLTHSPSDLNNFLMGCTDRLLSSKNTKSKQNHDRDNLNHQPAAVESLFSWSCGPQGLHPNLGKRVNIRRSWQGKLPLSCRWVVLFFLLRAEVLSKPKENEETTIGRVNAPLNSSCPVFGFFPLARSCRLPPFKPTKKHEETTIRAT